jgi:type IV secretory pathway TrbF-like protein
MAANPLIQFEDEQLRHHNQKLSRMLIAVTGIALLLTFAVCVLIFRPRTLPYLVMVNEHGEPVTVAQPVLGTQTLNDVVVKWAIAEFIRNAKTVTANIDEQKDHLRDAYAFAREQAAKALTDYYHDGEHDPFSIGQKGWVEVRITRAPLRLPAPDTYEVDWVETHHDYNSDLISSTSWRATLKAITATRTTRMAKTRSGSISRASIGRLRCTDETNRGSAQQRAPRGLRITATAHSHATRSLCPGVTPQPAPETRRGSARSYGGAAGRHPTCDSQREPPHFA